MKTIIFLIFTFIQFSANAVVNVVFVNGIDGSAQKSQKSVAKLHEIINAAGLGSKFQTNDEGIYYFMNTADGPIDDKVELLKQATISAEALTTTRNAIPNATADSSLYKAVLGQYYTTAINNGLGDIEEDRHIYSMVKKLADDIKILLADGRKVIVVAHSQGNFFIEATDAYLRYGRTIAENKIYDDNLRFVGAASVAASSPNGRYLSAEEDQALSLHRIATLGIIPFTVQSPNVRLCNNFILRGTCDLLLRFIDITIHGFLEIYTSTEVDKNSGKTLADILVGFINVSFDELVACTADAIGNTGYSLVFKGCSAANVAEYYDKTECVRDNATGLIWQGQTPAGTGLRSTQQLKTNYDSISVAQKYVEGLGGGYQIPTQAEVDAITNSIGFKNAVNNSNLCGFGNWRLPTKVELLGIVKATETPKIDSEWFPNVVGNLPYWTSTHENPVYAWLVSFISGTETISWPMPSNGYSFFSNGAGQVRLVR